MSLNFPAFDPTTIVIWIVCGAACFFIAKCKRRNPWLWLLFGVLFSFFAVVMVLFLPDGDLEDEILQLKARVRTLESARDGEEFPIVKLQKTKIE